MSKLPLNLIVFCTTMGHGGRHTYKDSIVNLYDKIDSNLFANKILHLKTRDGEEIIADEIKEFCNSVDIRVYHAENHQVHSAGYFKDIYKAYSDLDIRKQKYSFWLEDDELLQVNKISLEDVFKKSIEFLDNNPDQLCVRLNRADEFQDDNSDYLVENENIFTQAINYTQYGPTFTFQPNVSRTSEIFLAWKTAQKYLDKLGSYHCELVSGEILKKMSNSNTPFSFFNPSKAYSKHIG